LGRLEKNWEKCGEPWMIRRRRVSSLARDKWDDKGTNDLGSMG
jgi:hypothetical protein